jgi:pimeloyl-ACP methyl ester carboxylesterase
MRLPIFLAIVATASAQTEVRPVPPPGIPVPTEIRAEFTAGVEALAKDLAKLRDDLRGKPELLAELPSVEIFHKAVDWALRYDEFFDAKQFAVARDQLLQGHARAAALRKGEVPWNSATGLVVRAYRSAIDGSVQPYGLIVPPDWKPADQTPRRLDFWCHGRNEKLSELAFVADRQSKEGEFVPPGAFVLHLYGRYCNANKFAGERDLFEALLDADYRYPIDWNRLVVRGFSMGGAACWQFATHHPGQWAAAAPGAGFAETAEFFNVFAEGKTPPPWWEQVLWRWYDSTTMAANLLNVPTVAYSGEIDKQKQAADIMLRYAEEEGVTLPHIIGPQTAHKYDPAAKPRIDQIVDAAVIRRSEVNPAKVSLSTYSLIYPTLFLPTVRFDIMRMQKQWERADIVAEFSPDGSLSVKTRNVDLFGFYHRKRDVTRLIVDGQDAGDGPARDAPRVVYRKEGRWVADLFGPLREAKSLRKQSDTCGPIDHAFMMTFVFVKPTGNPLNETVGAWTKGELAHATEFWRKVFRGDAPVKDDSSITDDDIKNSNLVLWGDPSSNAVLAKILPKLPLKWDAQTLEFRGYKLDAAHHAPVLIFPNPLNPQKYVVLNSGVTFREQALLNNSDQTPKLPDWAIIDLRTPPGPQWPGLVFDAGFFDEQWR